VARNSRFIRSACWSLIGRKAHPKQASSTNSFVSTQPKLDKVKKLESINAS